jgi:hypothetical protein
MSANYKHKGSVFLLPTVTPEEADKYYPEITFLRMVKPEHVGLPLMHTMHEELAPRTTRKSKAFFPGFTEEDRSLQETHEGDRRANMSCIHYYVLLAI